MTDLNIPNQDFVSGTTISSSQMDANFSAIQTLINTTGVPKVQSGVAAKPVDVQVFTSSGTWTKPSGALWVEYLVVNGGNGGQGPAGTGDIGGASSFAARTPLLTSGAAGGSAAGVAGNPSALGVAGGASGTGGAGGGGAYGVGGAGGSSGNGAGVSAAANTGGGGGGYGNASTSGGKGGAIAQGAVPASQFSTSESVVIGAGGNGANYLEVARGGNGGSGVVIVTTHCS